MGVETDLYSQFITILVREADPSLLSDDMISTLLHTLNDSSSMLKKIGMKEFYQELKIEVEDRDSLKDKTEMHDLIDKIDDSQIFVPAFQREYVWKRQDAKALFTSLIKRYPTGTLLTWETVRHQIV